MAVSLQLEERNPVRRYSVVFLILVSSLLVPHASCADEVGLTLDAWFGWTSPLDDYFLTGDVEPLDLAGPISGSSVRMELQYDQEPWFASFVLSGGGSYTLTGGTHDVLRLFDLFMGAKGGISILRFLRPHVLAGVMYSHYILLVPHHELNSAVLHLYGLRLGGGIDIRVVPRALDLGRFYLELELGPEYVLDIMFSGTPILVQEFRGRATMRFIAK